ncbi:DUF2207 domain-containing protein [Kribbella sandramycini]|uniref:DUF2207 domain-containing protein n=1 Tax=Kribbella sandramycini TaxID=60450 RepID=A0A7Y4NYX1_9ACTN|nr:DUF2207 domain-containing protein [Kribbella sandramycini]MBB6569158.1 putative membrane protein YgcG [Kribbella sandramycini]NOL41001.1 DUF2207 domain-containing protein [Kribbella sandramycini]
MRRALGVFVGALAVLLVGLSQPAAAAPGDWVKRLAIDYTVTADGVLQVKETIDYHFGDDDRHGIYRDLIVREPYVDDREFDQQYDVSNITVSSTAPSAFTTSTTKSRNGRERVLRIKIGSSDETVSGRDATYVITYDVRGALRHFDDRSELYWDATGGDWDASLQQVDVGVTVPGGVQRVRCLTGPRGSTQVCATAQVVGGRGVFAESGVGRGEQMTVVAAIPAGAVSNDRPILVDPPGFLARNGLNLPGVLVAGLITALAIVARKLYQRFGGRDLRFAGPPGTMPPEGAAVAKDTLTAEQLPVAFAPPRIPVAEGGLLIDSRADATEIAATLIDLAVRGVLRIDNTGKYRKAVLVDPDLATTAHERRLLKGLFPSLKVGKEAKLERRAPGDNSLSTAASGTLDALRKQVEERGWYTRMPAPASSGDGALVFWLFAGFFGLIGAIILIVVAIKSGLPAWVGTALAVAVPTIAVVTLFSTWIGTHRRGQRSAAGRAVTDQLVGFRTYLTTAEADQLKFEDGEDIFSKYLPWAIVFGIADRWQQLCKQLVAAGRLTPEPAWYVGPAYYDSGFTASQLASNVTSTFSEPPSPSTSGGDGGGSSSGFSSSSSSGGGGGGGGGGSW